VRLISVILLLVCVASRAPAQVADDSPPEAVSRAFHEAMIRKDWTTAVSLVDPAELARNKAMIKPVFDADTAGYLMLRVLNDTTRRRFDDISDVEFNARLFAFVTGVSSQGSAIDRFQGVDVFAVARPADDQAFVIYQWRLPAGERPIRGRNVAELHRRDGKWRMVMLGDFTNLRELLEKR
jgi:hypothetical protein